MFITFVTSAVLVTSVLLVLSNLGTVADDTSKALRGAMQRIRTQGCMASFVAFATLWVTIFGLGLL
ncbi:hypothetical protein [Marivita geojedonensis]|uniref:Uncharacterized protein n=1 Tax=Marivita geojedonensis TaxID=1123756 RepID=A0A1X4NPI6_9RHOB|nr:hypothetical protein [Marivita geojedonensis]OSQ52621.1 hypothetical protein MGEO_04450 [Marivita geojedonensis]PRY80823.1 hypothetical protein CLV76_103189 [Marivita geojedonensis]